MICIDRRNFLKLSAVAGIGLGLPGSVNAAESRSPFTNLKPMTEGIQAITDNERGERIEKAQRLMVENKIDAIYLDSGTSLYYFTGVHWWPSERLFAAIIPARGEIAWVCPAFEESRARELIRFGKDIRTWEEDESPYERVAQVFRDRGIQTGTIGMEERVRFFLYDGIRKQAPNLTYNIADAVTAGCRMIKSPAELALMQRANDITIVAYKAAVSTLTEGMTTSAFMENVSAAFAACGVDGGAFASFGKFTAFPHGSIQPQKLKEGDVVLMDGGCTVEGYASDITRTFVFGKPTGRQRQIWDLERKAQDAGLAAAKPGATCESVDAAARKVITDAGFGPDYKVPGLPHRTGHGIGLDGHEWTYLVRGNKTVLRPGMCFSDEPTIAIYGEFGIRLEDCLYITAEGAKMFTQQSTSIDLPFA
jgi:Xaa-Pro aminopeptidase